jgi:hypothetical protein
MENLIQKYLKENNVEGKNGVDYRLEDSGNGIEIKGWTLPIDKPTFTPEESILSDRKNKRISDLKINRDAYLLQDYVSHQAIELQLNEDGEPAIEGESVYFRFKCKPTGNPASEPNSILIGVISISQSFEGYYITYSCDIIEGDSIRKGYIKLDVPTAIQLISHIQDRNTGAIRMTNEREAAINNATSLEEIEAIEITF